MAKKALVYFMILAILTIIGYPFLFSRHCSKLFQNTLQCSQQIKDLPGGWMERRVCRPQVRWNGQETAVQEHKTALRALLRFLLFYLNLLQPFYYKLPRMCKLYIKIENSTINTSKGNQYSAEINIVEYFI